ncbi:MAG: hypothetical protein KF791_18610 [Verrucomicrobiae bacterium]|nr:hypothetical protein [Verrucomicrobiae bacterium]
MSSPPLSRPVVVPEVLPPESPAPPPLTPPNPGRPRVWFEPLSALALLLADNLWLFPEFLVVSWVVTVPLCFLTVLVSVYLIQRRRAGDRRRIAFAKALILAIIAAVPTSVTGTPVGLAILAWAGIRHPWRA